MHFKRSSGILAHITSLPGPYGIGSFGQEAKDFVDLLSAMGMSYWQLLPLGTTDAFNSPYKSFSAFAGNPLFIDLDLLAGEGLLEPQELDAVRVADPYQTDYQFLNETRLPLLKRAFLRADNTLRQQINHFAEAQRRWLPDYALYMTLREVYDNTDWYDWPDEDLKYHRTEALASARAQYADSVDFQIFLQYLFYTQWQRLKDYAGASGIKIIGDMPIYLSLESADVWANRRFFDLDDKGNPKNVAGVPPDYFSLDGQLWGNPLYRWDVLKKEGYSWWIDRISHALTLYDAVRIDHFRGLSAYWAVPAEAKTAREGTWVPGPGRDLFDQVFKTFGDKRPNIIAEDLGIIDDGVLDLLEYTGFPGMRVLQFGFIDDSDNLHLPHNYPQNCLAYTGTHDNNTLLGYLWELLPHQRDHALAYVNFTGGDWKNGGPESASCRAFIRALWQSPAAVAIIPLQDLCGFGSDTKMNSPGSAQGNWQFRITKDALDHIDRQWMRELNKTYYRTQSS
ncbi:MAG: 4-alpha-glucanotransferase [Eubacterium sp.]|nr:4-alpha-glucanotransferase [Eubacterium sp.]